MSEKTLRQKLEATKGNKPLPRFETDEEMDRFFDETENLWEYDLSGGRPMSEVFPQLVKRGRPKSDNPKQLVTIRLDADLVERLKADGKRWQTRVNDMLRKAVGI
jgi:hypothetical protein